MLPKELKPIIRKYRDRVFIYEWEYFTKRIHDELIISLIEDYQFFYVEINFSIVEKELEKKYDRLKFWYAFFEQLNQKRYNDLCGFLDNDRGMALIFVHSNSSNNNAAWARFCEDILRKSGSDMQKWGGIIQAEYPPKEFFAKA